MTTEAVMGAGEEAGGTVAMERRQPGGLANDWHMMADIMVSNGG